MSLFSSSLSLFFFFFLIFLVFLFLPCRIARFLLPSLFSRCPVPSLSPHRPFPLLFLVLLAILSLFYVQRIIFQHVCIFLRSNLTGCQPGEQSIASSSRCVSCGALSPPVCCAALQRSGRASFQSSGKVRWCDRQAAADSVSVRGSCVAPLRGELCRGYLRTPSRPPPPAPPRRSFWWWVARRYQAKRYQIQGKERRHFVEPTLALFSVLPVIIVRGLVW